MGMGTAVGCAPLVPVTLGAVLWDETAKLAASGDDDRTARLGRSAVKRGGLPTVHQAVFAVSLGSKTERLFSMAQATPRSRSATERSALAWP